MENFNRSSNNIKTLDMNLDVLKQNNKVANHKKICINALKQRLILNKKKDKIKKAMIVSTVFLSVGVLSFIVG
tara:strand:- start:254 stop:472 length:219 start_codon:yes stop_codon:yes gene_type:complete